MHGRLGWLGAVAVAVGATAMSGGQSADAYANARWIAAHSSNYAVTNGRTIDRVVIHTIEGSEAGGISVERAKPWEQLGISRRTYYYRKKAGLLVPDGCTDAISDNSAAIGPSASTGAVQPIP